MDESPEILAARERMFNKKGGSTRVGGKGTSRRKKVNRSTASGQDEKKLQATLKKLGMESIPGIDEVNMFKDDGTVIHIRNPAVKANMRGGSYYVSGNAENKRVEQLLPGILSQLGGNTLGNLQNLLGSLPTGGSMPTGGLQNPLGNIDEDDEEDDEDDVPELVDDFENAANLD